ncbi:MAG: hypothetical protein ACK5LJ_00730 [Paracoccus sp. (in: a-proteobacteria)]
MLFRKKLSRPQFARFMADQPPCIVPMEACASTHHWAREMARHGHEIRLIAPEGIGYLPRLARVVEDPASGLPDLVRKICRLTLEQITVLTTRIETDQQAQAVA